MWFGVVHEFTFGRLPVTFNTTIRLPQGRVLLSILLTCSVAYSDTLVLSRLLER